MKSPKVVLITGATGGIGGALANAYAGPGVTLLLVGRHQQRLDRIAAQCRSRGAQVLAQSLDVRQTDQLFAWAAEVQQSHAVDLVIVNAGVTGNNGEDNQGEDWQQVERVLDVNLRAAMATVNAFLPAMRVRKRGQIALVSSISAWFGLPITPSYCASKAGIKAYGEALRGWLAPEGVEVNVILPGFVRSDMSDRFPGPKPFMLEPERAAAIILRGLARDRARISFPFPLDWGMWWLAVLPAAWSLRILRLLGYGK